MKIYGTFNWVSKKRRPGKSKSKSNAKTKAKAKAKGKEKQSKSTAKAQDTVAKAQGMEQLKPFMGYVLWVK